MANRTCVLRILSLTAFTSTLLCTSLLTTAWAQATSGAVSLQEEALDAGEEYVLSEAQQKKADVQFNQRRLLRFHQLWNLYLFRNEQEERDLKEQFEASVRLDAEAPSAAELEAAELEMREPKIIDIPLSDETLKLKTAASKMEEFNNSSRKASEPTRLGMMHAGMPVEAVTDAIRKNAEVLEKRLRKEIQLGGDRAELAKANLRYLVKTLLPKLEDRQYFDVSPKNFSREFNKVTGSGTTR